MSFDVFISYAWIDDCHRSWVRLFAAQLHAMGFDVGIDADVDYGNDLNGFMRKIREARHVLMIVDDGYINRADNMPESGVARENREIQSVIDSTPKDWLAPLFIRIDELRLPKWLEGRNPKGFDFRYSPKDNDFPGSEQIEDLWRWLVDLPANKAHAMSPAIIRERMYRVERIEVLRDPAHWHIPDASRANVVFDYGNTEDGTITLGVGAHEFKFTVGGGDKESVYVYRDRLHAVGLISKAINVEALSPKQAE